MNRNESFQGCVKETSLVLGDCGGQRLHQGRTNILAVTQKSPSSELLKDPVPLILSGPAKHDRSASPHWSLQI